jgi:hypothetical protein
MNDPRIESAREFLSELADTFVDGGAAKARPFVDGLAHDLEQLWTVPINRQDAFLDRMALQAKALPELGRLHLVNTTQDAFLRSIIAALRFAVRVAL